MPAHPKILYAARTASCTFLLDADGICRQVVPVEGRSPKREPSRSATRCVGAQYVASLDPSVAGMLADMPRVGVAMLFARVDDRGRVSLVRTGVVTHFANHREEDPFYDDDDDDADAQTMVTSASVETSAAPLPRIQPPQVRDPYQGHDEHTRPVDTVQRSFGSFRVTEPEELDADELEDLGESDDFLKTAEYEARAPRRAVEAFDDDVTTAATSPLSRRDDILLDDDDPTFGYDRSKAPRQSEPQVARAVSRPIEPPRTARTSWPAARGRRER